MAIGTKYANLNQIHWWINLKILWENWNYPMLASLSCKLVDFVKHTYSLFKLCSHLRWSALLQEDEIVIHSALHYFHKSTLHYDYAIRVYGLLL